MNLLNKYRIMLLNVIKFLIVFFGCIIIVALMSLLERKIIGGMQRRKINQCDGIRRFIATAGRCIKIIFKRKYSSKFVK